MSKLILVVFSAIFSLILEVSEVTSAPQYYISRDDEIRYPLSGSGLSLSPGSNPDVATSWYNYNRYGGGVEPIQYYPSSATSTSSTVFHPPSVPGYYPPPATSATPLLVIDSQVYAMYQLIKCFEKNNDLKQCVKLMEKCDELFKKNSKAGDDDDDDDDDEKKGKGKGNKGKKKGKKGKKSKKGKRSKKMKKDPDSESTESTEDDKDDNDDKDDADEDAEDEDDEYRDD